MSQKTPKCLHQIGDEILLDRLIRQLLEVGVNSFLINTHHLAERVTDHVRKRPDSARFTLTNEPELLGTLGTLRANVDFFNGQPGWVLHADNFIEGSLSPLAEAFALRPDNVWGCLLTFAAENPHNCGIVVTDERGIVAEFHEKSLDPPGNQASAATFVLSGPIFDLVRELPLVKTDISRDLVPLLVGRLGAVDHSGAVIDIGTPLGLSRAQELAAKFS